MSHSFATPNVVALALYIAAAVCHGADLFLTPSETPPAPARSHTRIAVLGLVLLVMGALFQVYATGLWCVTMRVSPFAGEFGTLSILAWVMALSYAAFDLRFRLRAVGAVALPLTCLVLFWGLLHLGGPIGASRLLRDRIISIHVLSILISIALFGLAFGCASLYLLQNRMLKAHRAGTLFRRLPPLTTLDHVAYQAVAYALPMLTVGLILGIAAVLRDVPRPAVWLLDPHNLASFVIWLLYVLYLTARLGLGWRGVRLQYILVAGLVVALALYVLPTSTHHFTPTGKSL